MPKASVAFVGVCLCLLPFCLLRAQRVERTIEVHAHRFAFEPSEISINTGETVRLRLISDDVPHSLLVKQLNIELTADQIESRRGCIQGGYSRRLCWQVRSLLWQRPWPHGLYRARDSKINASETALERSNGDTSLHHPIWINPLTHPRCLQTSPCAAGYAKDAADKRERGIEGRRIRTSRPC